MLSVQFHKDVFEKDLEGVSARDIRKIIDAVDRQFFARPSMSLSQEFHRLQVENLWVIYQICGAETRILRVYSRF